jgi:tetratricopeptide (TPR) repeat protein
LRDEPSNPDYRHLHALCYRALPPGPEDRTAAGKALERATEILSGLVRDYPQNPDYRFDLCEAWAMADRDPRMTRDVSPGVEERLKKAMSISEELVAEYPGVPEYLASQAHIHHKLGELSRRMRRLDDAEQSDRKAVAVQALLVANFPDLSAQKVWLAAFRNSLADTLLIRDKLVEARALSEETIAATGRLLAANPDMDYLHALLMDSCRTLSTALRRSGQTELADKAAREAETHRQALRERPGDRPPRKGRADHE